MKNESPLEMARRHVREGNARIRYRLALIERMRAAGANTDLPEILLEEYRKFVRHARDHLRHEEDARGWRAPEKP